MKAVLGAVAGVEDKGMKEVAGTKVIGVGVGGGDRSRPSSKSK